MTTPDEPRDPATSPSDTGWPVDEDQLPPPLETSDPTDAEEEGWPVLPDLDPEPEPEPEPEPGPDPDPDTDPDPEPEPPLDAVASEPEVAPAAEPSDVVEEAEPEPPLDAVASEPEVAAAAELSDVPEPEPEVAPAAELWDAADVDEPAAEPVAPSARRRMSAAVVALVLTTVLMAIANGFVWYRVHQHSAADDARRSALEVSRDAARVLFSYDYRTLAKDFAAGKAVTTGTFAKQYAETTAKVVTPVATDKKAVVKAEVVTAGVVRASATTVVTIVYVNQVTTSSLAEAPKVDLSRVRMTMTKVDGHWRVSRVDAL